MSNIDPIKNTIEKAEYISTVDIANVLIAIDQRAQYCKAVRQGDCSPEMALEYISYINDRIKKILAL